MSKLKELFKWVGTDGLLHFLVCYAIMLTLSPIIGIAWAVIPSVGLSVIKEVIDYCIEKDNNESQVLHDLIFDAVGIVGAIVVMALWNI